MDYKVDSDDDEEDVEEVEEERKLTEKKIEALTKKYTGKEGDVCPLDTLNLRMFN